jgi:hypothetical protein
MAFLPFNETAKLVRLALDSLGADVGSIFPIMS